MLQEGDVEIGVEMENIKYINMIVFMSPTAKMQSKAVEFVLQPYHNVSAVENM